MPGMVHTECDNGIAIITINNPPVNAMGHAARESLWQAMDDFAADNNAAIAVLMGAGKNFIGGADIREFGKPPRPPLLTDLCTHIERIGKPVIAAIGGFALGGGLEVALGAHYRLARADAMVGFPEVALGVIPGCGGTQRMPRLAGLAAALEMIPAGGRMRADKAHALGLIDRIIPAADTDEKPGAGGDAFLRDAAIAYARELRAGENRVRETGALPRPEHDADAIAAARALWQKKAPGEVARLMAIDAIEAACKTDFDAGSKKERALFMEVMATPQREALVHAFFSERKLAQLPELEGITPLAVKSIGVIGGGTMGSGIATACLLAGIGVTLLERDSGSAATAMQTITRNLDGAVERGKMTGAKHDTALAQLNCTTDMNALADGDCVIEAAFEDMAVKKDIFARLDGVMKKGAVLATNTSYLDINAIAAATGRPQDVIGLHFFSPAHVMRLVEIVVADKTAPQVTATAFALAKSLRKIAVRAGVCDGFIGNRILRATRMAAYDLVLAGATPWQVDDAMREYGMAMGPFAVLDLAGIDISHKSLPPQSPWGWIDAMVETGWLGRKTGRGYYIYGEAKPAPHAAITPLIKAARQRAGAGSDAGGLGGADIAHRLMCAMVNEAAQVLDEGIARRPLDIDMTLLHGYGFPRYRGGPMFWADAQGLPGIAAAIRDTGARPAPLLERLAVTGGTFGEMNG